MKLSIIIVSYNTKELLKQCLESVISGLCLVARDKKSNTLPITNYQSPTTEIIVIDNGSTDGSVEMLRKFKVPLQGKQSSKFKVGLIENKKNLGFAKAVNQGIKQAEGEIILLLNSDTQVKDGALVKLIEFEKQVRPAIIGARLLNPDGTTQPSCFHLPTIKRAIGEYWLGKKDCFSKYAPLGTEPVLVEAVSGGAMLVSREIIGKIGLFDERYFMFFEELDYCRRAGKAGYKNFYLPAAEIIHEHGASGKKIVSSENQWRRLIPSSKIYHGIFRHWLITLIIKLGNLK